MPIIGITGSSSGFQITGGTLTSDATYYYRTFTSSGTLGISGGSLTCDILVIAGGGSGNWGYDDGTFYRMNGAGGGAGGVNYTSGVSLNSNQTVTIGAGGARTSTLLSGTYNKATNGNNSSLGIYSATGGGVGSSLDYIIETEPDPPYQQYVALSTRSGGIGGSGGGGNGRYLYTAGYAVNDAVGSGTSGQGNAGGTGYPSTLVYTSAPIAGGGGGAGAVGGSANSTTPGNGGAGTSTYSSWGSVTSTGQNVSGTYFYAGGGGGGTGQNTTRATGGNGGGGQGGSTNTNGEDALANTGGGGGGGSRASGYTTAGQGGSGVVIVRYTRSQVGG